ncbi:MAG: DegT/DnrJ/EryC1/StrS family aminotransferase [Planctomycetaceae bacterium]|nr:DegT/DnrJ/EryC1/StrS family aminotransferase [Planctomycetaceae bacterium]
MRQAWIGTGPKAQRFEADFAAYKGVAQAAAVNSCTAAMHLACVALNLKPGDEVITTAMTFCASVNVIIHAGATPVLCDIDPKTLNIDPEQIEAKITPNTKALLIVHYAGRPCDMNAIMAIAKCHNLKVIEDCAHAIETEYHGKKAGTIGDTGCFSFYATKNIACGEGGMVIAKDADSLARIRRMVLHGLSADAWARYSASGFKHHYVTDLGFKYNMPDLQAAIGIHQLKRVEEHWRRREAVWNRYVTELAPSPFIAPPPIESNTRHAYHLFTIRIDEKRCGIARDKLLEEMTKRNIGVGVHYLAIPEQPYYRERYGWRAEDFPEAIRYGRECISLPISPKLTDEDVTDVLAALCDIVQW